MLYRVHLAWVEIELTTLVVIRTDCIGSCKSKYDMIPITTSPVIFGILLIERKQSPFIQQINVASKPYKDRH